MDQPILCKAAKTRRALTERHRLTPQPRTDSRVQEFLRRVPAGRQAFGAPRLRPCRAPRPACRRRPSRPAASGFRRSSDRHLPVRTRFAAPCPPHSGHSFAAIQATPSFEQFRPSPPSRCDYQGRFLVDGNHGPASSCSKNAPRSSSSRIRFSERTSSSRGERRRALVSGKGERPRCNFLGERLSKSSSAALCAFRQGNRPSRISERRLRLGRRPHRRARRARRRAARSRPCRHAASPPRLAWAAAIIASSSAGVRSGFSRSRQVSPCIATARARMAAASSMALQPASRRLRPLSLLASGN